MKNLLLIPVLALSLFAVMSFKSVTEKDMVGMYTIAAGSYSKIELKINADHTFSYQDYTDMNNIVIVSGRWEKQEEFIVLKDYVTTHKFNDIWKVSADGKTARSKAGIIIYTLEKREGC